MSLNTSIRSYISIIYIIYFRAFRAFRALHRLENKIINVTVNNRNALTAVSFLVTISLCETEEAAV